MSLPAPSPAGLARPLSRVAPSRQFLRFILAGVLNTGFGYAAFLVALHLCPTTMTALVASTVIAVLFNFATQGLYVFRALDVRRLWRFCVTYGLVFAYNAAGLTSLERLGLAPQLAGLILLPGAVLISYGLNSRFVFPRREAFSART